LNIQSLKSQRLSTPALVLDENEILASLESLAELRQKSGCKLLYSIKSLPFTAVLALAKPYVDGFSVSSLFEARLASEILAGSGSVHLTTPGIRPDELAKLSQYCSHISFNSLHQYQRFAEATDCSVGLRVNPKLSFVADDRYNPCRQHSKLGTDIDLLWQSEHLPKLRGLHVHNNFSGTDYTPLIKTVEKIELFLREQFANLEWLNLGGGYLFNEINNQQPFIDMVKRLTDKYGVSVYIEPGKAVVGRSGYLLATVIDQFVSDGKTIAVLDTSVNHHPEVFEYQFQAELHEQQTNGGYSAILAGSTCLAGDLFGEYRFKQPLAIGEQVVFKDLGAYSLIKASRFNGYNLPDIYLHRDGQWRQAKHYAYEDYRQQWLADS
jgi:carboxynorspermidine decarboxylase